MAQIHFIGYVGRNAESKAIQNGGIVTFSVADNTTRKNDRGEYETIHTDWFDCVIFTRDADVAQRMATGIVQGAPIYIEGNMQSDTYEKDGQKRTTWKVVVNRYRTFEKQGGSPAPF